MLSFVKRTFSSAASGAASKKSESDGTLSSSASKKSESDATEVASCKVENAKLDIVFLVDNTGSMGSYIAEVHRFQSIFNPFLKFMFFQVQKNVKKIAADIVSLNAGCSVRIAVVAYRGAALLILKFVD